MTAPSATSSTPQARRRGLVRALLAHLMRYMCRHRRSWFVRKFHNLVLQFHEAIENRNYDQHENGEFRVLSLTAATLRPRRVFDVGANVGDWSRAAAAIFPDAELHAFEPVAGTYRQLAANCAGLPRFHAHHLGMSDQAGGLKIYQSADQNFLATCVDGFVEDYHGFKPEAETIRVTTGDQACAEHGVTEIDFLKIDVEGLEDRVLRGFSRLLASGGIKVIQFEYGFVNIKTKFLLKDFYDFLKPFDMVIGKIYPTYVDFREYSYFHEDFLGPNFLAVHASQKALIAALADGR